MPVSMTMLLRASLYAVILGILFGAAYDVIRISRVFLGVSTYGEKARFNRIYNNTFKDMLDFKRISILDGVFVFTGDLIYSLFVTVSFVLFLFAFNYGIFRWFILVCSVLGFFAYYFTVGKLIIYFSKELSDLIKLIVNLIIFVVLQPLKLIIVSLKYVYRHTAEVLLKRIKCTIDIKKKKRYTVKCKEQLKELIVFR